MSFTREVTIAVKAPPMITSTAKSITLPREMNSRKSVKNPFVYFKSFSTFPTKYLGINNTLWDYCCSIFSFNAFPGLNLGEKCPGMIVFSPV